MAFEKSKWITKVWQRYNLTTQDPPLPLLRKKFSLKSNIKSATLNICGLGFGVYYINGRRVTNDVLTTPYTKYDATVLYQVYDVKELLSSENVIAVSLGNGMYSNKSDIWNFEKASWRAQPKLIAELVVEYEMGEVEYINTDSSWKCAEGPVVFTQVRSGEIYDARLEPRGWRMASFDDSAWENAVICPGAGGVLKPVGDLPPIRVCNTYKAIRLNDKVYDFGVNISGWCRIKVNCEAGREIKIDYSERIDENGNIDAYLINSGNRNIAPHRDTYITCDGEQEWEPSFAYHGFRYVSVENAPESFEIAALEIHNDLQSIGYFECSSEILNKIHDACRRTIRTNWHSFPQDCPHREQNGWTADAYLSAEASLLNYDMLGAYRKWLRDFKDVQRPDGMIPAIVPTSTWGYQFTWRKNNFGAGPAWDSALIQIPYEVYLYTGDTSIIKEMWEIMAKYFAFLESMSDDYIVGYGLGDWLPAEGAKRYCPINVVETAHYYQNAIVMGKMAELIGEESEKYYTSAEEIKKSFRKKFIKDGIIESGSQTAMAYGIVLGLYNDDEIPSAVEYLNDLVINNGYHFDCGINGTKYVVLALGEYGYNDTVYRAMTNRDSPSPAYWIYKGLTTVSEFWELKNSYNHPARSSIDVWFYKYLAGIHFSENGIVVNPQMINDIDWVKASYCGVSVEWDRSEIKITVPKSATIIINNKKTRCESGIYTFKR